MPKRKEIIDAFYTALDASTSISHVTLDMLESGFNWDEDQYPGVMVIDAQETKKRFAFPGSTAEDMESRLQVEITGFVRQLFSDTDSLDQKRANLLSTIERVVMSSTGIDDLILDVIEIEEDTDRNVLENIGWVVARFDVSYIYNHSSP